jgi:hypothetical protein
VSQEQQLLHDLLNDLTVINGHCSMMRDSVCEEANCRLKIILETSNRMAERILEAQKKKPVLSVAG